VVSVRANSRGLPSVRETHDLLVLAPSEGDEDSLVRADGVESGE